VFTGFDTSGWNFGSVLSFLSTFAAAVIVSASSSLDSALLMRRFLVGRSSSSAGGGRLFSVFLPTSEGALKGFMMPMPVFDLYRMQLFQAVVCSGGGIVHMSVSYVDAGRRVLTRSNLKWPQTFEDLSHKSGSINPNTNPSGYLHPAVSSV
jgi:hypothetical protein